MGVIRGSVTKFNITMVLKMRIITTRSIFILFSLFFVISVSKNEPFFRMDNGDWRQINTDNQLPPDSSILFNHEGILAQILTEPALNESWRVMSHVHEIEQFGDKKSISYNKPNKISLNGEVCLFLFSDKDFNGICTLHCNYSPRGTWLEIKSDPSAQEYSISYLPEKVSSYQFW